MFLDFHKVKTENLGEGCGYYRNAQE